MDFKTAVTTCLKKKYICFSGRASRSEFGYFMLFVAIVIFISLLIGALLEAEIFVFLIAFIPIALPNVGVTIRRFHDLNLSGWFTLLQCIPIVGHIAFVFLLCKKGIDGDNKFGPVAN